MTESAARAGCITTMLIIILLGCGLPLIFVTVLTFEDRLAKLEDKAGITAHCSPTNVDWWHWEKGPCQHSEGAK